VAPHHFAPQIRALHEGGADLKPLWEPLTLRRAERSQAWQAWLAGEGEQPASEQRSVHVSQMEAPEDLPDVNDALRSLDE